MMFWCFHTGTGFWYVKTIHLLGIQDLTEPICEYTNLAIKFTPITDSVKALVVQPHAVH